MKVRFLPVFNAEGGAAPAAGEAQAAGGGAAPATGEAPATTETPSDWTAALPDDLKGYVANKGWDEPVKVAQSYRELEKFAGSKANFIEMPDPSDTDALKGVLSRLGAPTNADDYKIEFPEGVTPDENIMSGFRATAAEVGLLPGQAQKIVDWFEGMQGANAENAQAENQARVEQQIEAMRKEWGQDFNANVAAGQTLVRALGLSTEEIDGIEQAMGTPAVMNLMVKLGQRLGDNTLIGEDAGNGGGGFAMTPQQASAKIGQLGADKAFRERMYNPANPGHKSALAEMDRLQQIAAGA